MQTQHKVIAWVTQVARISSSKGTLNAHSGLLLVLEDIKNSTGSIERRGNPVVVDSAFRDKIAGLESHVRQANVWRSQLDQASTLRGTQGMNQKEAPAIDIYLRHVAMNICQVLEVKGSVLFPVDFFVNVLVYEEAPKGHASLIFIEKQKNSSNSVISFFETGGHTDQSLSLDKLRTLTDSDELHWSQREFGPNSIEVQASRSHDPNEKLVRFAYYMSSGVKSGSIDVEFIRKLLVKFVSIDPPAISRVGLNDLIASHTQAMVNEIHTQLATVGQTSIPPQYLQFSQSGGECEHAALMAFACDYVKKIDPILPDYINHAIHSKAKEKADVEMSSLQDRVKHLESEAKSLIQAEKTAYKSHNRIGTNVIIKKIYEGKRNAIMTSINEAKTEIRRLTRAMEGILKLEELLND